MVIEFAVLFGEFRGAALDLIINQRHFHVPHAPLAPFGNGHFLHQEKAAEVNDRILRFLVP